MTRENERPKKKLKSRKWSIRLHLTNMQNDMAERQVMLRDQDTIDQDQIEPQEVEYLYMLPEDDAEVLVSGASMAIIDIGVWQGLLPGTAIWTARDPHTLQT